jgi:hypothetical protein
MGDDLKDKLIQSCEQLHSKEILNDNMLLHCKSQLDPDNFGKQLDITENKIFGEQQSPRKLKISKYDEFITNINDIIDKVFQKIKDICDDKDKCSEDDNVIDYKQILDKLSRFLNEIINYIDNLTIKRYYNTESIHYTKLLNKYNKIEINRKKLLNLNKNYTSLQNMNEIENDKIIKDKNISKKIFIVLVIIFILLIMVSIYINYYLIIY